MEVESQEKGRGGKDERDKEEDRVRDDGRGELHETKTGTGQKLVILFRSLLHGALPTDNRTHRSANHKCERRRARSSPPLATFCCALLPVFI